MAEKRRVGMHSGEALAEMGEKIHARHDIWSKIQKVEAIGVHDVTEEIREGGAEAARKVVDEERVPIWAGFGEGGGDDARGRMPRRLASRFAPPQVLEVVPEFDRVYRRWEIGVLRPPHRQPALRRLLLPGVLGHSLASTGLGCHGGCGKRGIEDGEGAAAASEGKSLTRRKKGTAVQRLGKARRVNEQRAHSCSFLRGRRGPPLFPLTMM